MCQGNEQYKKRKQRKISLNPLKFDETVSDILKVNPELKENKVDKAIRKEQDKESLK